MINILAAMVCVCLTVCCGSVRAQSPLWADPAMKADILLETSLAVTEDGPNTWRSWGAFLTGRYEFNTRIRTLVELPFIVLQRRKVVGKQGPDAAPLFSDYETELHLGNLRAGVELGERDDVVVLLSTRLPTASSGDPLLSRAGEWLDPMRPNAGYGDHLEMGAHVHVPVWEQNSTDLLLRGGVRVWQNLAEGRGLAATLIDIEPVLRLRHKQLTLLAGPAISIIFFNYYAAPSDDVGMTLNLAAQYQFGDVAAGLIFKMNASDRFSPVRHVVELALPIDFD